ncbi:LysR family transcriptional regulator [uncultured Bosea sp.]|uniref:LysR family transcriptional regulator n=1 Tax=uncultured Bosea sp. TaxID=211457 RepID=UPI0025CE3B2B|nr:LysR family transcriptional regulator [uncultured Bosea sp.]
MGEAYAEHIAQLSRLIPSARGLLVFEAAARTGSFTAAAAEFNVSQPSISRSVAELEAAVGARLFERRARGLELTADGSDLFGVVGEAVGRIADAVQAVSDCSRSSGRSSREAAMSQRRRATLDLTRHRQLAVGIGNPAPLGHRRDRRRILPGLFVSRR